MPDISLPIESSIEAIEEAIEHLEHEASALEAQAEDFRNEAESLKKAIEILKKHRSAPIPSTKAPQISLAGIEGVTNAVMAMLSANPFSLFTPSTLALRMRSKGFKREFKSHESYVASVHSTLARLAKSGRVIEAKNKDGKLVYRDNSQKNTDD